MSSARTALVLGPTGATGRALVEQLIEDPDCAVVVLAHRRETGFAGRPKVREHLVDADGVAGFAPGRSIDDVYCCLGTTIRKAGSPEAFRRVDLELPLAWADWAAREGVRSFSLVTSQGAHPAYRLLYFRTKGEVEEGVKAAGIPRVRVLRPTMLLAERGESRPLESLGLALLRLVAPLLVGPLRRFRPVPVEALARALRRVAADETEGSRTYESAEILDLAGV